MEKIINLAVIAHVDAGKSTLVDAFINQSGAIAGHQTLENRPSLTPHIITNH